MEAVFMFHKCKSAFNEYWSFFTLLLQLTSTMLRRYQARLFDLKSQFCGPYISLYSECGQFISWLLTSGTAYHSQPEGSNNQTYFMGNVCL